MQQYEHENEHITLHTGPRGLGYHAKNATSLMWTRVEWCGGAESFQD